MSTQSNPYASAPGMLALGISMLLLGAPAAAQLSSEEFATTIEPVHDGVLVQYDVEVPMRDGFVLSTDVYRPAYVEDALPTILMRVPYGKRAPYIYLPVYGRFWARRGFAFVAQDVRGRFASNHGTAFDPMAHEVDDGYDTVGWIAAQPWSNGRVGQMGESYYGYTSLASAVSAPPALACVSPSTTAADFSIIGFRQGVPNLLAFGGWLLDMDAAEYQDSSGVDFTDLPLASLGKKAGIRDRLWLRNLEEGPRGEHANRIDLESRLASVKIPMLHLAGFYDNILGGNLRLWQLMQQGAAPGRHWIVFGPWDHEYSTDTTGYIGALEIGFAPSPTRVDTLYRFFKSCLTDDKQAFASQPRVSYFAIGANEWRSAEAWPPPQAKELSLYFVSNEGANGAAGDGRLERAQPEVSGTDRFTYDPAAPVVFSADISPWSIAAELPDRSEVAKREDVLVYQTEPLEKDLEATGPVKVVLFAATSAVDTDFTAVLVDVHPDGYAHQVQNGVIRASYRDGLEQRKLLEPGQIYELAIDLWATSYLFAKGHRVRVEISSSDFPHYARNLNTGERVGFSDRIEKAEQTIHHSKEHPSRLVLSLIE
jgi:putative CocE/NonD family hydrolase